jgi:hypothetical protein
MLLGLMWWRLLAGGVDGGEAGRDVGERVPRVGTTGVGTTAVEMYGVGTTEAETH